ncbi:hypothetical protein, partial [Mesorhizobium sp. M4B.F.Ca.ET.019.03.1.1]
MGYWSIAAVALRRFGTSYGGSHRAIFADGKFLLARSLRPPVGWSRIVLAGAANRYRAAASLRNLQQRLSRSQPKIPLFQRLSFVMRKYRFSRTELSRAFGIDMATLGTGSAGT